MAKKPSNGRRQVAESLSVLGVPSSIGYLSEGEEPESALERAKLLLALGGFVGERSAGAVAFWRLADKRHGCPGVATRFENRMLGPVVLQLDAEAETDTIEAFGQMVELARSKGWEQS